MEHLWRTKQSRLNREAEEQKYWEWKQEQARQEKLLEQEQSRKAELETKASDWKKAGDIRAYIEAIDKSYLNKQIALESERFLTWKEWALAHANDLDPIVSGNPLVHLTGEMSDKDENEWV